MNFSPRRDDNNFKYLRQGTIDGFRYATGMVFRSGSGDAGAAGRSLLLGYDIARSRRGVYDTIGQTEAAGYHARFCSRSDDCRQCLVAADPLHGDVGVTWERWMSSRKLW